MPIQAPLDALEIVFKQHFCEPDDNKQIVVRLATSKAAIVDNRNMPDICLQHMVAVMLIDKTVSFRAAHDKAPMQEPAVLRQRAKVKLVPDEPLQRLLPKRAAVVEVTFTDGTHITRRAEAVRGTAENPMTRDEVIANARDPIAPVLGEITCASRIERVFGLEDVIDIRELRPLI